ncbi:uncharacterized protein LOC133306843 [Gastrolobium bilobum]|uniref:uncharacterized protein LOC133306843 n=1 Tax=Gastrolobium bilobum TaxID=150636 RepID=UPI002AB0457F|nr:uncharacterized protein LOC133306843 [Gastrolobium bilobum]
MEKEEEHKESVDSLLCPSFSTYCHSSNKLADIAQQVIQNDNDFNANDNDFEFVAFPKAADGVFFDGDSGRFFPIFNRDLVTATKEEDAAAIQFPMRKLLIGDEEKRREPSPTTSSSSSEVEDDLVAIPAGTYCVWTPNSVKPSPDRCKKSNSTGSSSTKRWKLLDLLRRSNSDGKESSSLVLVTPSSDSTKKKKGVKGESSKEQCGSRKAEILTSRFAGKKIPAAAASGGEKKVFTSAHEALYLKNRETRKRSYLPYRQELVGFFSFLSHRKF